MSAGRLRWLIPLAVVPVLALLAYGFRTNPRDLPSPLINKAAAPFSLTSFDGAPLSLGVVSVFLIGAMGCGTWVTVGIGLALERMRQWDEALASLERATVLAPQRAEFHTNLGALYRRLGHDRRRR